MHTWKQTARNLVTSVVEKPLMIMLFRLKKVFAAGLCAVLALSSASPVKADALGDIGLTQLLAEFGNGLNGDGIIVGMVEAYSDYNFHFDPQPTNWNNTPVWFFNVHQGTPETSPGASAPYTSDPDTNASLYQHDSNQDSNHAPGVAWNYASVASGVDKVEVIQADYFINQLLTARDGAEWQPVTIDSRVVSQSYVSLSQSDETELKLLFDAYANANGTFFVNGVNNESASANSYAPGTMYNGITVGNKNGSNSLGVHLVAPQDTSSNATPMVAGAAAVLLQAAEQNFGTNSGAADPGAADNRVLKALLINGANKGAIQGGWGSGGMLSNGLDQRYGAGMLNVYSSYKTLTAGRLVTSTTGSPVLQTKTTGWDLQTLTAGASNSYFFEVPSGSVAANTITATLTWNSITTDVAYASVPESFTGDNHISDFNLGLWYLDETNGWELVTEIDAFDLDPGAPDTYYLLGNVAHLYLTDLEAGTYELRVTLEGVGENNTTDADTYAIAYALNQVPEPSTSVLVCLGTVLTVLHRKRNRRQLQ